MKKAKGNRFSRAIGKFLNVFTFCSRPSMSHPLKNAQYANSILLSTPSSTRSNIYLTPRRLNFTDLKLPFCPTTFTTIDHARVKKPTVPLTPSSSPSISECHSSLTTYQCSSANTTTSVTTNNIEIPNNKSDVMQKSTSSPRASSRFSYVIRPTTPCIFGTEYYDDEEMNDDEFFVTAGAIVHSCPNIYELTIDNHRQLQSCDHLVFLDQQTTAIDDDTNENLNCYDTEFDRYSILPRFQPISSLSISTDSINSELELYRERHAFGLPRRCHDDAFPYSASFLPTTWRSDNYLFFLPFINPQSPLLNSIDHGKRSRSYDIPMEQTLRSSLVV